MNEMMVLTQPGFLQQVFDEKDDVRKSGISGERNLFAKQLHK